jgi:tetratricopeptide (TPR) repeat protein
LRGSVVLKDIYPQGDMILAETFLKGYFYNSVTNSYYMHTIVRTNILILIVVAFFLPLTGVCQSTVAASPGTLKYQQVSELFDAEQYQNVQMLTDAIFSNSNNSQTYQAAEIENLHFLQIASGVILDDPFFVARAKELIQITNSKHISVDLAYHLGHYYFLKGLYPEALFYLELTNGLYLAKNEQHRTNFEKGVAYFSQKKFDNAVPYFKSLPQESNSSYANHAAYYLGFISFAEGKYVDALPLFVNLQKDPVYSAVVPFYLSYIYYKNGQIDQSIQTGEAYLKSDHHLHKNEVLALLASIYFNRGESLKAVNYYERALSSGVVLDSLQHFELGSSYHDIGQFSKSVEQLKPLSIGTHAIALNSMFILGDSYLQLKEKANARSAFQYYISGKLESEKMQVAKFLHAKLSLDMGFEDQAIRGLTDFLSQYPNSNYQSEAKEILLLYYARTNNYRQALEILHQFSQSSASYQRLAPRIFYGRGIELVNDLQYTEADALFAELNKFRGSPFYAPGLFWRGELALRNENYSQCINFLTDFLKQRFVPVAEATVEHAWYNLGYAYFELEDYQKAMPYFEKLHSASKNISPALRDESLLRAADCAFMEKNTWKAKSLYSQVSNIKGNGNDYASFQLAIIAGITSPRDKIDMLKLALQKFPSSMYIPLITMELSDTYMAEEEYELAISPLTKIASLVDKDDEFVPESYLKLGIAYYNLDRTDQAISQFEKLVSEFPASAQAAEALESAKAIFVEKGQIDNYQAFLKAGGRSIDALQKDSLLFQYVQTKYADGKDQSVDKALDDYIVQFPEGLFIADVLNYKAELYVKLNNWAGAASYFDLLASKGATKYQEKALRQSAKIYFFELADYANALTHFSQLVSLTTKSDILLEAMRGQVRSYYFLKLWKEGSVSAQAIIANPSANLDDKSYAGMIVGYFNQLEKQYGPSNEAFMAVSKTNRSALGAEARYQIAVNHFAAGNFGEAESASIETIEQSGSYDQWITRAYILLGDIFFQQKDFFNARATFKSVIENCKIEALKIEAQKKLNNVEIVEKNSLKTQ